jgi:hypothetical protein
MSFRRFFCEEKWGTATASLLILAGLSLGVPSVRAQFAPGVGDPIATQNAMNEAGGTATIGTGAAMDAAQGVAGGAPGAMPGMDPSGVMMGSDPYGMGTMMRRPPELPGTSRVSVGRRVIDALSYRLQPNKLNVLDDVRDREVTDAQKREILEAQKNAAAGQPEKLSVSEYVDGGSFGVMQTTIGMLNAAQKMDPLKFFGVAVLSTEPNSVLPTLRQRVRARDRYIYKSEGNDFTGWSKRFLQDFRKIPEDPAKAAEFFSLYMPSPPDPPAMPAPPMPSWKPPIYKKKALDRAIAAYMAQQGGMQQPGTATGTAVADPRQAQIDRYKELKRQLKDKDFRDQFLAQYGQAAGATSAPLPGMGMGSGGGYPGAYGSAMYSGGRPGGGG